jgi:hypothetical protein
MKSAILLSFQQVREVIEGLTEQRGNYHRVN